MKLSNCTALAVATVVAAIVVSPAFAKHHSETQVHVDSNGNTHSVTYSNNGHHSERSRNQSWHKNQNQSWHKNTNQSWHKNENGNNSWRTTHKNWNWDKHNWNEQRSQLHDNWRSQRTYLTAAQQARLDADMKIQWRQYKNNNWNGQYTWDQYSDPRFLDYVHTQNPSLLTTIRSYFGY